MLNIINPVTNMNGGGNSIYTHYVTIYSDNNSASTAGNNISLIIKDNVNTPINSYELLQQWLIDNGFTNKIEFPARGSWGGADDISDTILSGIYVNTEEASEEKIFAIGYRISSGQFVSSCIQIEKSISYQGNTVVSDVVL